MNEVIHATIKLFLTNPFYLGLIILGFIGPIIYPKLRGFMGEFWARLELQKLPKDEYIVLNDIMLKYGNCTHQIDHIVLSKYGIFVIEMKNYYGKIYGNEYKDKWIQYLGKNKYYFHNPIRQNYGHVQVLKNILEINEENFISIVCFSNQVKLKIETKSKVTQLDYLNRTIEEYKDIKIKENLKEIEEKLKSLNIENNTSRKNHIKTIKKNLDEKKKLEENKICPKCSGTLIDRKGKYGNFYGCSNFPKCKYTSKK